MAQAAAALTLSLRRFLSPGVPKYVALRDALLQAVGSGAFGAGSRLPNEAELAATLPLSLGTIQRALRSLADDGVIVRRQGRGTFVAEPASGQMHAPLHCRFVDDAGTGYLPVYPVVTARYTEERDGPWTLHVAVRPVLCIERVLRIADEFKVFSRFYVDAGRMPAFASLPARKLSGENFKEIIWRESGLPIGRVTQFLSQVRLPRAVCRAVGVRNGVVGQRLDICAFAGQEIPLYYQELMIPPNRRRLHLAAGGRDRGLGSAS